MENNIKIDFSKLEKTSVKKCAKTIFAVTMSGLFLLVLAVCVVFGDKTHIWNNILILCLMILSSTVLCYIVYKLESIQVYHAIEEEKADTALRRKLAEEAIMREIKISEKTISDAQKREYQNDKDSLYKDIEKVIYELNFLCSVKTEDDRIKEIKKLINDLEQNITKLKS